MLDSPLVLFPLVAFALSAALHGLALTMFPRWGLLDFPERYGLKRGRIPYPAGIIAVVLFCVLLAILEPLNAETSGLLAGILLLAVFCFVDDRTPLPPLLRIAVQAIVALLLIVSGTRIDAVTNFVPWWLPGETLQLQSGWLYWFSVAFTGIWLLLTINALNWFDGIAGQVSTVSTLGFLTIGLLSLSGRVNQPALALVAFTLAGISLGSWLFDFPPAKLLMGDTGAMFYGLMIGVLTISSGGKVATAFLVLGVPLLDLVFVVVRRLHRKESVFRGNARDQHLHHRLLARGWSPRQVILLTACVGAAFGVTALFLSTKGKIIASSLLVLLMLALSWYSNPDRGRRSPPPH